MLFTIRILAEIFYFIRNLNLVLPHCFLVNLLQSFVSGSKTVPALNGKVLPSAGYHTYKTWVEHVGADPIKCPSNDLITYFDNVGKYVIKSYNLSSKRTARADIITATLHFDLGDKMLQSQEQLKPGNWHEKPIHQSHKEMEQLLEDTNDDFCEYHLAYIKEVIETVMYENDDVAKKYNNLLTQENVLTICAQKNLSP